MLEGGKNTYEVGYNRMNGMIEWVDCSKTSVVPLSLL